MAPLPNPLRAFELLEPLASGGMGRVFRARHRRSGQPVAVKLILERAVASPEALEAFAREARAAARLDHPHITRLIDYGLTDEGEPVLVMELAGGGDLTRWVQRPPTWATLREAIGQLLDALAHAHARGVVHRDLKPSNVLSRGRRDRLRGVALTDLGLVLFSHDPAEGIVASAGTPQYMAPEQAQGALTQIGPWTDLYGLGALVWAIAQGGPPPADADDERLELAWHPPRLAAPPGLGRWVCGLLASSPWRRPRHAAIAAEGLRALEGLVAGAARAPTSAAVTAHTLAGWDSASPTLAGWSVASTGGSGSAPTLAGWAAAMTRGADPARTFAGGITATTEGDGGHALATDEDEEVPLQAVAAPLPVSWRPGRRPTPSLALLDAGLGLHSLREPELVGRESEQDALWSALRRVESQGTPGLVLLRGGVGVGRSRLVSWLAERAQELAGVAVAAARIGPGRPLSLEELVNGLCAAEGLPPDPAPPAGVGAEERVSRALRRLRALAGARPLVLTLDDAAFGEEALRLAERAVTTPSLGPTLVVVSAQEDALAARPAAAAAVERLAARPDTLTLTLGDLPVGQRGALVSAVLRLAPDLRGLVAERAAGNPLFTTLLIGDWVKRGILEAGPLGFSLKSGEPLTLHADLSALQRSQVEALQARLSEDDWRAVGVASALGVEVDLDEWRRAVAEAGLTPSPSFEAELLHAQVLRPLPGRDRWAFTSGLTREALLVAVGAAPALQLACARALEHDPRRADRVAQHRLAGGDAQGALGLALAAVSRDVALMRIDSLGVWLRSVEACLSGGAMPTLTERASLLLAQGVFLRFGAGRIEAALALFEEATPLAEAAGEPALVAELLRRRAGVRFTLGENDGEALLGAALALAEAHGLIEQELSSLRDLSLVVRHRGGAAEAERLVRRAIELAERHGWRTQLARARSVLAGSLLDSGRSEEALTILELAFHDLLRDEDASTLDIATAQNSLAAALHNLGRLEPALEHYWGAYQRFDEAGSELAALPRYNVASIHLNAGRPEEARALLEEGLIMLGEQPSALMRAYILSLLVDVDAQQGALEPLTRHLIQLDETLSTGHTADGGVKFTLERTAKRLDEQPEGVAPDLRARLQRLIDEQTARLSGG
jgi:tetratricopeptide (TPR) repeat protein